MNLGLGININKEYQKCSEETCENQSMGGNGVESDG